MPRVHVVDESTAGAEEVLSAAHDFSPRRAELWRDVYEEHLTVHDNSETWAEVTEGNPWPVVGLVWERLRYDWSDPNRVVLTTTDSNLWGGASGHTYTFTRKPDGTTTLTWSSYATARTSRESCSASWLGPSEDAF